ncbi:ZIP family metal transporter [Puia sp. P3]|uniref:ZIP family metal transporter n=1 Tax=Puia sp. P3 TaxID=3423952 RepID=UPI003D674820
MIPVFTMLAGSVIAILKTPNGNIRSLILHFAAGVVFSVVAVEILPDVIKEHKPLQVLIGFCLGFILMIGIRRFSESKKTATSGQYNLPIGLLVAIGIDICIDGVLLGIGFAAGNKEGVLLAIALSIELLSLGMATATELRNQNTSKRRTMILVGGLALVFFISAVVGATLLHKTSDSSMEVILSFGLSALLFLVTEELLTEAHEEKETVWHTSVFFGGFLLFLILGMINF